VRLFTPQHHRAARAQGTNALGRRQAGHRNVQAARALQGGMRHAQRRLRANVLRAKRELMQTLQLTLTAVPVPQMLAKHVHQQTRQGRDVGRLCHQVARTTQARRHCLDVLRVIAPGVLKKLIEHQHSPLLALSQQPVGGALGPTRTLAI
jgi:hypothetical protein